MSILKSSYQLLAELLINIANAKYGVFFGPFATYFDENRALKSVFVLGRYGCRESATGTGGPLTLRGLLSAVRRLGSRR